jgi:Mrp family chromosome partitioning ATPase
MTEGSKGDEHPIGHRLVGRAAELAVLAHVLDGTLLVAKAFVTDSEMMERSVKSLRDAGAKVLGAVLNAADGRDQRYRYRRGYYYQYGHYPDRGQAKA